MRLSGVVPESVVDGPGLRYVLFTQGCPHACEHCHNPESWTQNGGYEMSVREITRTLKRQKKRLQGITFSGGEPFLQSGELLQIAGAVRELGWNIVTYTGFTYEDLTENKDSNVQALLAASDILVDGSYVHKLRDISLCFRGSSNQRVIDLKRTRKSGEVTLFCE